MSGPCGDKWKLNPPRTIWTRLAAESIPSLCRKFGAIKSCCSSGDLKLLLNWRTQATAVERAPSRSSIQRLSSSSRGSIDFKHLRGARRHPVQWSAPLPNCEVYAAVSNHLSGNLFFSSPSGVARFEEVLAPGGPSAPASPTRRSRASHQTADCLACAPTSTLPWTSRRSWASPLHTR